MRFLVTGATGFIGLHLCRALGAAGHSVVALVRSADKARSLPAETEQLIGDLSIFRRNDLVLAPADVVVHLAGVVSADEPDDYDAINHRAVGDLLDCISRQSWKPGRLLFASSLAAAGPSSRTRPWTEADPLAPIDPYGMAKARAEALVAAAPYPTTCFRPCIVLGPDDPATLTLFRAAQAGLGVRVAGEPQRLSFVDVRDVVSALLAMAADPRDASACYYVSHPDPIDVQLLWQGLTRAFGRRIRVVAVPRPVLYAAMRGASFAAGVFGFTNQLDSKQYAQMTAPAFLCSSEALRTDLGWAPRFGLDESLTHALAGYRRSGLLRPEAGA